MKTEKEIRAELATKQVVLAQVFETAKTSTGELDMGKVEKIGTEDCKDWTAIQKGEKIRALNTELNDLGEQAEQAAELKAIETGLTRFVKGEKNVVHGNGNGSANKQREQQLVPFMKQVTTSERYIEVKQGGDWRQFSVEVKGYPSDLLGWDRAALGSRVKALFERTAGWPPESTRTGIMVDAVTRPIQVLDLLPTSPTGQMLIKYMEETTRTHAAAGTAEGALYPESTFELTERSSPVEKVASFVPATDEQLADEPASGGYLSDRLSFGCQQTLDNDVINGDGVAPNLRGILNTAGIQTHALGGDAPMDSIHKMLTKIRLTGRANPTGIVMHQEDWETIRLTKTQEGLYIMGHPTEVGPFRLWGLPVAAVDVIAKATRLVGDFAMFCRLFEREGLTVQTGYVNDDFTRGRQTLRAQLRAAFVVLRPAAFGTVTDV